MDTVTLGDRTYPAAQAFGEVRLQILGGLPADMEHSQQRIIELAVPADPALEG
jgi:hypothetical protein